MINEKTVFILGAGASMHAGFPSGRDLLDLILESNPLEKKRGPFESDFDPFNKKKRVEAVAVKTLYSFLEKLGYNLDEIERFKLFLNLSQLNSVDAFLERRPEFIPIGKLFTSYFINYFENSTALYEDPNWYRHIWNKMNSDFEEFEKNNVSFVTFNYDKSLEYYLLKSLIGISGKPFHECWHKLSKIPIIHLHGQVGSLSIDKLEYDFNYGLEMSTEDDLKINSGNIKIIHEQIDDDPQFTEAHNLFAAAQKIIFLGFGYNQTNIDRLKLKNIGGGKIFGSTIGLTDSEVQEIRGRNENFEIREGHYTGCEEFLRHRITLR